MPMCLPWVSWAPFHWQGGHLVSRLRNEGSEVLQSQEILQAAQAAASRSRMQPCDLHLPLVRDKNVSPHCAPGPCPDTGPACFWLPFSGEISHPCEMIQFV